MVVAGNTRPTVTIEIPEDGQFADFGDTVPYKISVTDPEDGTIDCTKVTLSIQLGHDEHAHGLGAKQGCEGTFADRARTPATTRTRTSSRRSSRPTPTRATAPRRPSPARTTSILHTRRKRAEHFSTTGRARRLHRGRRSRASRRRPRRTPAAATTSAFIENGDYISFNRDQLRGPHLDRLPRRLRRRGRQDRAARWTRPTARRSPRSTWRRRAAGRTGRRSRRR